MSKVTKRRKIKSPVWNYFVKQDSIIARCKLCTKLFKHTGNTTNLMQHLNRKHAGLTDIRIQVTNQQQQLALRTDPDPKEGTLAMNCECIEYR